MSHFHHEIFYPQPSPDQRHAEHQEATRASCEWGMEDHVKHTSHPNVLSIQEITVIIEAATLYFMVFSDSETSQLGWCPKPKFPTSLMMN